MTHRAVLNEEEQETMEALTDVMTTITRRWRMTQNASELASAVHVIQGFVVQHMLHRLEPESWSSWQTPPRAAFDTDPDAVTLTS
jgi:hypothetical protein